MIALRRQHRPRKGYFWLPCPRCGQMFGGHEMGGTDWQITGNGKATCWRCPEERTLVDGEWRDGAWRIIDGELVQFVAGDS